MKKAFTLIELVVVMAIIAVLTMLVVGAIVVARNTATETTNRSNSNAIRAAYEAYYARYRQYCGHANALAVTCTAGELSVKETQFDGVGIDVNLLRSRTISPNRGGYVSVALPQSVTIQVSDHSGGALPLAGVDLIETINLP